MCDRPLVAGGAGFTIKSPKHASGSGGSANRYSQQAGRSSLGDSRGLRREREEREMDRDESPVRSSGRSHRK